MHAYIFMKFAGHLVTTTIHNMLPQIFNILFRFREKWIIMILLLNYATFVFTYNITQKLKQI